MEASKAFFYIYEKYADKNSNQIFKLKPDMAKNIVTETNLNYSKNGDPNCTMDLCYDKREKNDMPVIVYVHGGGFVAGAKECRRALSKWYASHGYFVINANYGLCPETVFPEPIRELAQTTEWIKDNAEKYHLDKDKVVIAGDSAGAYYASMLACATENKALQKKLNIDTDFHFAGSILNCGLYDVKSVLNRRLPLAFEKMIFESFTGIETENIKRYSYKNHLSPTTLANEKFPPTLFIYAEKDIMCKGQTEKFKQVLDDNGVYNETFHSTSLLSNHCFSLDWTNKDTPKAMESQAQFLEKIRNNTISKDSTTTKDQAEMEM